MKHGNQEKLVITEKLIVEAATFWF